MPVVLAPISSSLPQFFTTAGAVLNGGKIYTYSAGTTTPLSTYTDSTGNTANANPIILNSDGRPPNEIWLTSGSAYKFLLQDSAGNTIKTIDQIRGVNDVSATQDEWVASGLTPTYVSATSFTLAGDQTSVFHEGRRLKITDGGGTKYATITGSAFSTVTTVTVAGDALASPTSAVSYGLVTATNPSISSEAIHRKGTAVASAATCDIWNTQGDFIHITGNTGPITSFGTAPYAGARKEIVFDSTPTITHNATTLVLPGGANITAAANDRMIIRADTTANMIVVDYIKATGKSVINTANTQPTRQVFTSGTGATYTTPAGATRINVRMVGGGGGGGANATNAGANGTSTTFDTLTAAFGSGGTHNAGAGGAGGTGTNGDINISGGSGQGGTSSGAAVGPAGGNGGASAFGGAGGGGANATAGSAAAANSGSGGGGGGGTTAPTSSGGGGGAGGYVEKLITSPSASYTYTVGAGGNGGAAGNFAGGNGAAGIIIVDEHYD